MTDTATTLRIDVYTDVARADTKKGVASQEEDPQPTGRAGGR